MLYSLLRARVDPVYTQASLICQQRIINGLNGSYGIYTGVAATCQSERTYCLKVLAISLTRA